MIDDTPMAVAPYALELGLDIDWGDCEALAAQIGDEDVTLASVRAAAERLGMKIPAGKG